MRVSTCVCVRVWVWVRVGAWDAVPGSRPSDGWARTRLRERS